MTEQSSTLHAAIRAVLDQALSDSADVVVLGETAGLMDPATHGLAAAHGADRVRALPIADRGTLGAALGMALAGKRPVVELSGTNRLIAGLEVLTEAASITRKGGFTAPVVVRVPYGTEAADADQPIGASILAIEGLTVVCARDANSAAGLLRSALASRGPVVLLEPRTLATERSRVGSVPVPFSAQTVREGDHITLAAWGNGVDAALAAAESLAADGISAEVLDLVALSPLDTDALAASIRKTGRLVVVHPDDPSLADAVRAVGLDSAFLYLESPLASAPEAPEAVVRAAREAVLY